MMLLKYTRVSLLVCFLFCSLTHAATYYNRCDHKYQIQNIDICSEKVLSDTDLTSLSAKYRKALFLFPDFINRYGYSLDRISIKLTIYLMPHDTLNDEKLFTRPAGVQLHGRYRDNIGKLYISYNALSADNTDFIHELAHYFNNNVKMLDDDQNEKISLQFEQYYLDNS
jgi:hypothetical protein